MGESQLAGERKVLGDAIKVRLMDADGPAQGATAFAAFGLIEVTTPGMMAQRFAAGGDLKPLGHCFPGFNAFRATHIRKSFSKKSAHYMDPFQT
jgi:hypothetical protein